METTKRVYPDTSGIAQDGEIVFAYEELADGVTKITISGEYSVEIHERLNESGGVEFVCPAFRAPQDNLKDALKWVGINTGKRAADAAWDLHNPAPKGKGSRSAQTATQIAELAALRAKNEEAENQIAKLRAMIAAMQQPSPNGVAAAPAGSKAKAGARS